MGATTRIDLTTTWVQIASNNQRALVQRLNGQVYLQYQDTQPDPNDNESFRLSDSEPMDLENDVNLWARAQETGAIILAILPTSTTGSGLTDSELRASPLDVTVTNQLDLSVITSHLSSIKDSCLDIDANTDTIEQKLLDIITAINTNGAVNHADLLDIIADLQAVDANTDSQEALLTIILNKLIASPATLAEQQSQTLLLGSVYQTSLPDLSNDQQIRRLVDKKGRALKSVTNGRISYVASSAPNGLTPANNALKDFWFIKGSATKTVYIKKITVSAYAGGRSVNSIGIQKRSGTNTGGNITSFDVIPIDSNSPATGVVVGLYTTTPTTEGTLVATVASSRFLIPKNDDQVIVEKDFVFSEPIVLNNANESLTLQCGRAIVASALFFISVEWDEE